MGTRTGDLGFACEFDLVVSADAPLPSMFRNPLYSVAECLEETPSCGSDFRSP